MTKNTESSWNYNKYYGYTGFRECDVCKHQRYCVKPIRGKLYKCKECYLK